MKLNKNPLELIAANYIEMNKMMVKEIELATAHPGLTGNYREEMWKKFFRTLIPLKFSLVHGAMIIDAEGGISNEVDIAVIDEQYTPYIFHYHTLKLVPIEAVSLVIECKSKEISEKTLEKLDIWAESIENLKANRTGIARVVQGYSSGLTNMSQKKTSPIKVLVCLKESVKDMTLDKLKERLGDHFDFIIQEQSYGTDDSKMFQLLVKNEGKTLGWWGNRLNIGQPSNNQNSEDASLNDQARQDQSPSEQSSVEDKMPLTMVVGSPNQKAEYAKQFDYAATWGLKLGNEGTELYNTLEDLRIEGNPLLTLNLQLNQLLMLINNPMLFPHFAYAKAFKKWQAE